MSKYVLDEGVESFEIEVKNRKKPIVVTFCPTDEGLVERFPIFFDNIQKAIDETKDIKVDVYGNAETPKEIIILDKLKETCIKETDRLLNYEGNGKELFGKCNPFRATKSGYWIEQVFNLLYALIAENAPDTIKNCDLNLSARGKAYAAKYLK